MMKTFSIYIFILDNHREHIKEKFLNDLRKFREQHTGEDLAKVSLFCSAKFTYDFHKFTPHRKCLTANVTEVKLLFAVLGEHEKQNGRPKTSICRRDTQHAHIIQRYTGTITFNVQYVEIFVVS